MSVTQHDDMFQFCSFLGASHVRVPQLPVQTSVASFASKARFRTHYPVSVLAARAKDHVDRQRALLRPVSASPNERPLYLLLSLCFNQQVFQASILETLRGRTRVFDLSLCVGLEYVRLSALSCLPPAGR